jgi:hypothetical protein
VAEPISLDSSSEQNCPHDGELMTRYGVSPHRGGQARKVVGRRLAYLAMPLTRAGALHSQRTLTASGARCSVRWQLTEADASFRVVELPGGATGGRGTCSFTRFCQLRSSRRPLSRRSPG